MSQAYIISNHLKLLLKFSGKFKILSDNFILGNRFLKINSLVTSHTRNTNLGWFCHTSLLVIALQYVTFSQQKKNLRDWNKVSCDYH